MNTLNIRLAGSSDLIVPLPLFNGDSPWSGDENGLTIHVLHGPYFYTQITQFSLAPYGPTGCYYLTIPYNYLPAFAAGDLFMVFVKPNISSDFDQVFINVQYGNYIFEDIVTAINQNTDSKTTAVEEKVDTVSENVDILIVLKKASTERTILYDENGAISGVTTKYSLNESVPNFSVSDRIDNITISRQAGKVSTVVKKKIG